MIAIFGACGGLGRALIQHLSATHDHRCGPVVPLTRTDGNFDVSSDVQVIFRRLSSDYPPSEPWHIVNLAGESRNGTILKQSESDFEADWRDNVLSSWLIIKHSAPFFKDRPHSSVTLASSVVGRVGVVGAGSYGAAKSGLHGLVRCASKELARHRCRVNALELGYFDAGMISEVKGATKDNLLASIPLKRLGNVFEFGRAVEFCIDCTYLTGSVVPVNGGLA